MQDKKKRAHKRSFCILSFAFIHPQHIPGVIACHDLALSRFIYPAPIVTIVLYQKTIDQKGGCGLIAACFHAVAWERSGGCFSLLPHLSPPAKRIVRTFLYYHFFQTHSFFPHFFSLILTHPLSPLIHFIKFLLHSYSFFNFLFFYPFSSLPIFPLYPLIFPFVSPTFSIPLPISTFPLSSTNSPSPLITHPRPLREPGSHHLIPYTTSHNLTQLYLHSSLQAAKLIHISHILSKMA